MAVRWGERQRVGAAMGRTFGEYPSANKGLSMLVLPAMLVDGRGRGESGVGQIVWEMIGCRIEEPP
jgi:hypothetical protein